MKTFFSYTCPSAPPKGLCKAEPNVFVAISNDGEEIMIAVDQASNKGGVVLRGATFRKDGSISYSSISAHAVDGTQLPESGPISHTIPRMSDTMFGRGTNQEFAIKAIKLARSLVRDGELSKADAEQIGLLMAETSSAVPVKSNERFYL